MSDLHHKYKWLQMAFSEQVDRINECFYFDRRDNEFYSIFITDFFLTDQSSQADYLNNPYSKKELVILEDRLNRQDKNDSSILPLPRLSIDERKQMMQRFLDTKPEFENNGLLQTCVDTESGQTNLDFNSLLDVETKQDWDQFKAAFIRERIDSFCNLNKIDMQSGSLWAQDKMITIQIDLNEE